MNKPYLFVVLLALAFALPAMADGGTGHDLFYLQNGSGVRVSIETYRAKEGWTPVIVSVAGAEVSAVMDEKGCVWQTWAKGPNNHGLTLFTIKLDKGHIMFGNEAHAVRIYEQNNVRTRFEIAERVIQFPVRMDPTGRDGRLLFGGLEIPAQVSEVDRPSGSRIIDPMGMKPGWATARSAGPTAIPSAGCASAPPIVKGPGAKAQLVPSRLRARTK